MGIDLSSPTIEAEARLLLLIDAFTTPAKSLEGRTKLAKLDFLLRYPEFLRRAIRIRAGDEVEITTDEAEAIESRMVRYRYGPWDPSYFSLLGRLLGKQLVEAVPYSRGIAFRTTGKGLQVANDLRSDESWQPVADRTRILKRNFDVTGKFLKDFIYQHFPEVTSASWGEIIETPD